MNYICKADDEFAACPFRGFQIRCPKYETDLDTLMVKAHVECYKIDDNTLNVEVWAVITNAKFRWYVMDFSAEIVPDVEGVPRTPKNIIRALVKNLNESEEFDRGMRRAVAECKAMLDRLAL